MSARLGSTGSFLVHVMGKHPQYIDRWRCNQIKEGNLHVIEGCFVIVCRDKNDCNAAHQLCGKKVRINIYYGDKTLRFTAKTLGCTLKNTGVKSLHPKHFAKAFGTPECEVTLECTFTYESCGIPHTTEKVGDGLLCSGREATTQEERDELLSDLEAAGYLLGMEREKAVMDAFLSTTQPIDDAGHEADQPIIVSPGGQLQHPPG